MARLNHICGETAPHLLKHRQRDRGQRPTATSCLRPQVERRKNYAEKTGNFHLHIKIFYTYFIYNLIFFHNFATVSDGQTCPHPGSFHPYSFSVKNKKHAGHPRSGSPPFTEHIYNMKNVRHSPWLLKPVPYPRT